MKRASIDGTPTKPLPEDGLDIPTEMLRVSLNQVLAETLRPVAGGLGTICLFFGISHLFMLATDVRWIMAAIAITTGSVMLAAFFYLEGHDIPPQWAHPVVGFLAILVLLNPIAHILLVKEETQTTYFVLIILGLGSIVLSTRWFIGLTVLSWAAWAVAFSTLPVASEWLGYAYSLVGATGLAAIIFAARVGSAKRLERFRIRDAGYKTELEVVLKTTDEAQRSLATSMAIGQSITSVLDLDKLLPAIAEIIELRFNCVFVGIFLLDESEEYVICRAGSGADGRALTDCGYRLRVGEEGIVGIVAKTRRPERVDDVARDERYLRHSDSINVRALLALPLEMGNKLLGVLDMESEREGAFKEDDVPFLQLLADQVAIAIYNATLYQSEKTNRQLTENLFQIGNLLSSTLDLSAVLKLILQSLSEMVSYDRADVMLWDADENKLDVLFGEGFSTEHEASRISVQLGDVLNIVCRSGQPLAVSDIGEREDWSQPENLPPARSWLGVPLIHNEAVIGMLSLTRQDVKPYQESEIGLAMTFAGQASIALQNARLYEQITRFNQDLEDLVKERTEALQTAYDQLERLDQAKSKFISIASHELRTPITLLKGYTQMMLENAAIKDNGGIAPMVIGIESGAERLHEIIESMLDVAKIDNQELRLNVTPILVPVLLSFVREGLQNTIDQRQLRWVEEFEANMPPIDGDLEGLRKVFYHLMINAIKYTPDEGKINIIARKLPPGEFGLKDGGVEVIVQDSGIGIDPDLADLIFAKFYQTGEVSLHSSGKSKFKGGGPGLGLAIARGIVAAHNGLIWVESPGYNEQTYPGSRFHVALPMHQKTQ